MHTYRSLYIHTEYSSYMTLIRDAWSNASQIMSVIDLFVRNISLPIVIYSHPIADNCLPWLLGKFEM